MAKDKLNKVLEIVENARLFAVEIFEKIIHKIHQLDPSSNTKQRVISGVVMITLAVYAIFFSKNLFLLLAIALTILMVFEWIDMTKNMSDQKKWRLIGFFYILIPVYCVIKIRFYDVDVLFWMFAVIWATDIFAFFAGRSLGGKKLAPTISPNKTWSGLAGGVIASALIGLMSAFMFSGGIFFFIFVSVLLSVIEQCSDLLESKFKRIFGVKDSGNIIPGHGGVLDRLDGMMLVAPVVLFLITAFSSKFGG